MGVMTDADPSPLRDGSAHGDPSAGAESGSASGADAASLWDEASARFGQWRRGDARAMDALVRLMTPVLWHVVRAYGLERSLAEDVVQTTWLTLVRSQASIVDERAVAGWLTTCARREAWRVGKAHARTLPTEDVELEPQLPVQESAERTAQAADRDARLWRAVRGLEERCRRLLRVIAFEERPDYAKIARDLSMPVGSIGPTRQRCLAKLRTALNADGWEGQGHDR
jgi:RNA polymerase sigma factor (sigma-70 family)